MHYETLKLKHPLENLTELKVRRPKVKDIKAINSLKVEDEIERDLIFFEMLTGVSRKVLEELDVEDWNALQNLVMKMMGNSSIQSKTGS